MKILQASANSSLLQNDGDDDDDDNDDGEHTSSSFQFIAPSLIHAGDSGSDGEYDGGVGVVMNCVAKMMLVEIPATRPIHHSRNFSPIEMSKGDKRSPRLDSAPQLG